MLSPEIEPLTYFDLHPIRVASSCHSLGIALWDREIALSKTHNTVSKQEKHGDDTVPVTSG